MTNQLDRINRSLSKLSRKFQGLSPFISHLQVTDAPHLAVAGTDGHKLMFNLEWVGSLNDEQLDGLVMHEVIHVIDDHIERAGSRPISLWNSACDIRTNYILRNVELPVPQGTTDNPAYDEMDIEDIYSDLVNQVNLLNQMTQENIK
jgi:predicted metal-dependent peptidase